MLLSALYYWLLPCSPRCCLLVDTYFSVFSVMLPYISDASVFLSLFLLTGVEDAFSFTSKVMTVSLHKFSPGFFPGK